MDITKELLEKAKSAKTAEELLELAKAENIEMTAEQAAKAFAELNKRGELSDEELDNIAGGCGGDPYQSGDTPKFNIGDSRYYYYTYNGRVKTVFTVIKSYEKKDGVFYYTLGNGDCIAENKLFEYTGNEIV